MSASSPSTAVPQIEYKGEVWRKLLHLFALVMPIGYHVLPRWTAVGAIIFAFAVALFVDLARFRGWDVQRYWTRITDPMVRPKESVGFTGATHILFSGFVSPLLFSLPAATLGMVTIILGDTAAALVGRRWGRHKYNTAGRSWEGSGAFLLASVIGALFIPGLPLWVGLVGALVATVVEGISDGIDDNLSVPLIVGLFAHLSLRLM